MKQPNRTALTSANAKRQRKSSSDRRGRLEMHRIPRRLLIFLLIILLAAILLAGYNVWRPIDLVLNTPVLNYQRESAIDYQVLVKPNDFTDQTVLGMDQLYLQDFSEAVDTIFSYAFKADRTVNLQYRYRIDAILQMHDASNPGNVLLQKTINLLPERIGKTQNSNWQIKENLRIDLADYQSIAASFATQTNSAATFDLDLTLFVQLDAALPAGPLTITDTPVLSIPLNQQQFRLSRQLPASRPINVWQPIHYKIVLAPIPFPVYPAAAGLCLLCLVMVLIMTCSRRKNRFRKQLSRMMRYAKSRLMIIGDKAWEPEWCITATDFRSLIRTAKKLKHPVFCYVDWQAESPAAYFYVYYGENNYCYTFGQPTSSNRSVPVPTDHDDVPSEPPEELPDSIPVLPETDNSPEILLSRLKIQTGTNHVGLI